MTKIGLVVEGGGMKCSYGSGVLDRFLDDHVTFPYVNGVSAGSAIAMTYLAGQRDRNLRFYTDHIHEDGYFGVKSLLKTGDLFNLDYIYGDLTNEGGEDPIDFDALMENPSEFEIVATNALTGKPEYFQKGDLDRHNYQAIKASCALPAACKPRLLYGIPYYDGGVSDPLPVDRALQHGKCDKVVVILSKTRDYKRKPQNMKLTYHIACANYPKIVDEIDSRHISYTKQFRHVFDLEKKGKAFVFAPSSDINVGTYTMDENVNQQLYDLGVSDYDDLKDQLEHFMAS